jgi:hypothetical protein
MGRHRKNPEVAILATKWHGGQPNNDAEKIKHIGFVSPDTSASYAVARHIHSKTQYHFVSQERFERWLAKQPDPHAYYISVRQPVRQIV